MSVRYQCGANSQLRSFGTHHITLWEILRQTPPKWLMEWYHVVTALSTWNCKLSNGCPAWFGWAWEIVPDWRFGSPTCNASRSKTRSWQRRHQCRPWEIAATQSGKDTATYTGRSRHASCVTWKPNGGDAIPTTPPGIPTIKDKLQWSQEGWWEHVWIVQLQVFISVSFPRSSLLG